MFMVAFFLVGSGFGTEHQLKQNEPRLVKAAHNASIVATALLFIACILHHSDVVFDFDKDGLIQNPFAIVFIAGSLILLTAQVVELLVYLGSSSASRSLTKSFSLILATLGTTFLFLGGVFSLEEVIFDVTDDSSGDKNASFESMKLRASLSITGAVLYLAHAIFYLMKHCMQSR
jgi:hypothetical protein